jgi:hypothetical protein
MILYVDVRGFSAFLCCRYRNSWIATGLYRLWEPNSRIWMKYGKSLLCRSPRSWLLSNGTFLLPPVPELLSLGQPLRDPAFVCCAPYGIGIIAAGHLAFVASALGWLLEWIIRIMNEGVFIVESLPFSVLDGVYIDTFNALFSRCLWSLAYMWIETKTTVPLILHLHSVFCISMDQWIHFQTEVKPSRMTFYSIPGHTAVDFIASGKILFPVRFSLEHDALKIKFHLLPGRLASGVKNILPASSLVRKTQGCSLMVWNGQSILRMKTLRSLFHLMSALIWL